MYNNGIILLKIARQLERIADALEESNNMVKDLGNYKG